MIETVLAIMLAGIATVGIFFAGMVVLDIWRKEDHLPH